MRQFMIKFAHPKQTVTILKQMIMKKILSLLGLQLMAAATIMAADVNYKVTGELPASFNGCKIFINQYQGRNIVALDSAVVAEGKFAMSGKMAETSVCTLSAKDAEGKGHYAPIVIEDTPAMVSFADNEFVVKGGRRNQALEFFTTKVQPLNDVPNARELVKEYRDSTTTQTRKEEIEKMFNDAQEKFSKAAKDFVKENADNIVGAYVFASIYNGYEDNEVDALMAQAGAEFKGDKSVQRILEVLEKSKLRKVGAKFTDFTQPDKDGNMHKLSEYVAKSKYLLVDFWASWCGPCRAEMPNVKAAYEKYHAKGFEILGVSLDNKKDAWLNAIKTLGLPWQHVSDLKGWQCEASGMYGVQGIPCTMLIAQDGTIVATDLRGEELDKKLAELLK